MSDVVEDLRLLQEGAQWACGATAATLGEAADEIVQLRAEIVLLEATGAEAADEIERLRGGLENIAAMRPTIPVDDEGNGPNWQQYIYTKTWASFAADLQDVARAALKGGKR